MPKLKKKSANCVKSLRHENWVTQKKRVYSSQIGPKWDKSGTFSDQISVPPKSNIPVNYLHGTMFTENGKKKENSS